MIQNHIFFMTFSCFRIRMHFEPDHFTGVRLSIIFRYSKKQQQKNSGVVLDREVLLA